MEEAKSGGLYWKRRIKQSIAETIYAKLECIRQATEAGIDAAEVTPQIIFPARYSITNVQPPVSPDTQVNKNAKLSDPEDAPEADD